MVLSAILAKYSHVRRATSFDNDELLKFLKQIPTQIEKTAFRFDRGPDFYKFLRYQSDKSFVFIFENNDRSVGGIATLCVKTCYLNQVPTPVVYLSDIRLSPRISRGTRLQWRAFYHDLVAHSHELQEFEFAPFLFTLVMDENRTALTAFTGKRNDIVYENIESYETLNILGRLPTRALRSVSPLAKDFKVRNAYVGDLRKIRKFLYEQNIGRPLGHYFSLESWSFDGSANRDELQRRLNDWDDFEINDFILVENRHNGELVGCVAPWSPDEGRRLVVDRLPPALKILGRIIKLIGRPPIVEGQSVKTMNLTHLEIRSEVSAQLRCEIFSMMLDHLFRMPMIKDFHLISLADFKTETLMPALKGFVVHKTPASLYEVYAGGRAAVRHSFPTTEKHAAPAFEIAIP